MRSVSRNRDKSQVLIIGASLILVILLGFLLSRGNKILPLLISGALPVLGLSMLVVRQRALFPYFFVFILGLEELSPAISGGIFTIPKVGIGFLFIAYVLSSPSHRKLKSKIILTSALVFSSYFILSLMWSILPAQGYTRAITLVFLLLSFGLVVHFTRDERDLWNYGGAIVLYGLASAVSTLWEFSQGTSNVETLLSPIRTEAISGNPNSDAYYMALASCIIIGYLSQATTSWRWLPRSISPFALAILSGGVLATGSRGGLIAFVGGAGITLAMVLTERSTSRLRIIIAFLLVTLTMMSLNNLYPLIENMVLRFAPVTASADITANRLEIWSNAWFSFLERPWGGYGIESAGHLYLTPGGGGTHNSFVWALLEGGLIGGVLFTWMLFSSGWSIYGARKQLGARESLNGRSFTIVLFGLMACSLMFMMSANIHYNKIFWVILALIEATRNLSLTNNTAGEPESG